MTVTRVIFLIICAALCYLAYYSWVESNSLLWTVIYAILAAMAAGSAGLLKKR